VYNSTQNKRGNRRKRVRWKKKGKRPFVISSLKVRAPYLGVCDFSRKKDAPEVDPETKTKRGDVSRKPFTGPRSRDSTKREAVAMQRVKKRLCPIKGQKEECCEGGLPRRRKKRVIKPRKKKMVQGLSVGGRIQHWGKEKSRKEKGRGEGLKKTLVSRTV